MPQVSLYVDDATMTTLRKQAQAEGVSLSKHVARRLAATERSSTASGLTEGWLESLYGCLADDESFTMPDRSLPDRVNSLPSLG